MSVIVTQVLADAPAGVTQLSHKPSLFKPCERAGNLPHGHLEMSSVAVRSSPVAVSTRTPRPISAAMPNFWVTRSRASRLAPSTMRPSAAPSQ